MLIELDPVDRLTADAVGPPGERTFYIQARKGDHLVTIVAEKQQVQLLAASVVEILARIGKETAEGPPEEAMALEEPLLPEWRAGRLSIGYEEERDLLVLEIRELQPQDDDEEDEDDAEEGAEGAGGEPRLAQFQATTPEELARAIEEAEEGGEAEDPDDDDAERLRVWATREQMLSLARHGAAVCAQGRPRCRLCGNPIGPDGHTCPALNGHRELGSV